MQMSLALEPASARSANHRSDGGRAAHANLANHLEAVAPIQRDVRGIRRLEIRMQVVLVDPREGMTQQRASDALTLMRGIDADEGEVPVRLLRMRRAHLLEDRQDLGP